MTRLSRAWRIFASVVVTASMLAGSPAPAAEVREATLPAPGPLALAAARAGQRALPARWQEVPATAGDVPEESRPFLKTRRGAVVIALMAAGSAYVIYSKFHDRVRSPAK